jgi:hypothetical protein
MVALSVNQAEGWLPEFSNLFPFCSSGGQIVVISQFEQQLKWPGSHYFVERRIFYMLLGFSNTVERKLKDLNNSPWKSL